MDKLFKYLVIFFLTTMVFSCQNRPSDVLSRKKMENVMYDMYIAEAIIDNDYRGFSQPEDKEALIFQVLDKHKISEARWDTSLSWYSDNIDLYIQINDSVKSRLQRSQLYTEQLISENAARDIMQEEMPADFIPRSFYLAGLGCNRGFRFTLDSTQLVERFVDDDTIYFSFKVLGAHPLDSYSLKTTLQMEYSDTTIYQSSEIAENRLFNLPLIRHIEQDTIVSLNGFVNLSGNFPPVAIQLYNISLGSNDMNDSTVVVETPIKKELLDKPKLITE